MPTIIAGFEWDQPKNHDSELSLGEMIAIVNRVCDEVPKMKNPPPEMPAPIKALSDALQGKVDKSIIITKGIHQADQLHFTLLVKFAHTGAFHIFLGKGNAQTVYSKPKKTDAASIEHGTAGKVMPHTLYLYQSVGISYEHPLGTFVNWPSSFKKNSYPGRVRRNSLSEKTSKNIQSKPPTGAETKSKKLVMPPNNP